MTQPISYFLPDSTDQARRAAIVSDHFPGTGAEQEFTGYSDAELLTFTSQTAVSYADLLSKIGAVGLNSKVIIECAWNGVSTAAATVNCNPASSLTANAGVDWGYNRPSQRILVRPASGFSPSMRGTGTSGSDSTSINGLNYIEFRNMTFDGFRFQFTRTATYPIPAIIAIKGCTLKNSPHSNGAIECAHGARLLHMENNTFDGNRAGSICAANWLRAWSNIVINHHDNDFLGVRGFDGYALSWRSRIWTAGNLVYSPSQSGHINSGLHFDYCQVSTNATDGNVAEHEILHEFNIAYLNRPRSAGAPQGVFGDDGITGKFDWLVHNNIIAIGAYWGALVFDPSNDAKKTVTRNIFTRKGTGPGTPDSGPPRLDTTPRVQGLVKQAGTGIGTMTIRDNFYCVADSQTGQAFGEAVSNNVNVDPRKTAAAGVRMQATFAGNGTWAQNATDLMWEYDIGDQGQSAATARALIRDFFAPIRGPQGTGYAVAPGDVGCTDPNLWPTSNFAGPFATVPAQMGAPSLASTATRITFTLAADPSDGGSAITSRDIQYSINGGAGWTVLSGVVGGQVISGLTPGATGIIVQSRANNAIGNGPWSGSASIDMKNVSFVGFVAGGAQSANYSLDLTTIDTSTGGIGGPLQQGDVVIVSSGWASSNVDQDPGVTGYTEIADLFADDTRDTNHSVSWKAMGATPDSSATVNGSNNSTNGSCGVASIFRYVDAGAPFDITATSAIGINSGLPDSPAIAPSSSGAVIVIAVASTGDTTPSSLTAPSGMVLNGQRTNGGSTRGFRTLMARASWAGGTYDPGPCSSAESSTSDSWTAVTMALKPW